MNKSPKLVCKNVWKLYGDKPKEFLQIHNNNPDKKTIEAGGYIQAIRNASLEVYENEILVIMGLSGSGKSTLVRCMSRLVDPTIGEIFFENIDMGKLTKNELIEIRRHKMGMVFQHFALFPHRTVIENIAFPLEVQGINRKEREKSAFEIIDLVGLQGRENYFPKELSGGQQQRVAIARALVQDPAFVLADEPTGNLDKESGINILNILKDLNNQGKTVIMITHNQEHANMFKKVVELVDGKIVKQ